MRAKSWIRRVGRLVVPVCLLVVLLGAAVEGCQFLDVLTGLYTGTYVEFQACKLDEEGQSCRSIEIAYDICVEEKGVGDPDCVTLWDKIFDCVLCDFFFAEAYLSGKNSGKNQQVPMLLWTQRGRHVFRTTNGGAVVEELADYGRWPLGVAVDADAGKIYWTDGRAHALRRSNLDGTEVEDLIDNVRGSGIAIDPGSRTLFFGNVGAGTIEVLDLETMTRTILASDVYRPIDLAFDSNANALYWTHFDQQDADELGGSIRRLNLSGTTRPEVIVDDLTLPFALTVDARDGMLYWSDLMEGAIHAVSLSDPGKVDDVLTQLDVPAAIAVDPATGTLYFTEARKARTAMASLADPVGTQQDITGIFAVADLAIDSNGGFLYWTGWLTGSLGRVNLDGSAPTTLVFQQTLTGDLALDPVRNKVYWVVQTTGDILRANVDGSDLETVLAGEFAVGAIDFDPLSDKLYWNAGQGIRRADPDGSNAETLISTGIVFLGDLEVDSEGGKLYWSNQSFLQRSNLDGSQIEFWITENDRIEHLAFADGILYYTIPFQGVIKRVPVNESMLPGEVVTDVPFAQNVEVSDGMLYWSLPFEGTIQRSGLDGSEVEDVVTNANNVGGIVIGLDVSVPVEEPEVPSNAVSLSQPYPNPFFESTTLTLAMPRTQHVSIRAYDILGRVVAHVHEGVLSAGPDHTFTIDADGWPAGTYVIDVRGEAFRESRTAILVR